MGMGVGVAVRMGVQVRVVGLSELACLNSGNGVLPSST